MAYKGSMPASSNTWWDMTVDDADFQNVVDTPVLSINKSQLRATEQHDGFDNNVGDTWLYPNNLPQREYQLSIVKASLFKNTLVVLPTGLGKTFIAAVVMYNIYRWYPTGKIIFMAPTRPLVAQQIEACHSVMPFPDEDTVELTGRLQRSRRKELWNTKRVFFATPHVVQSDIIGYQEGCEEGVDWSFPFHKVKLIVVDEAHRAKGRYAYTEVIRAIKQRNNYFRVLALSATPGRTMEDVAEVVRNLFISHIEVRCETSIDVLPYVHKRFIKTIVVTLTDDLKELYKEVLSIIDPYIRQLIEANVLSGSLQKISRNFLLFEQKRFRELCQHQQHPERSSISKNFSFCISMYHALELLERHGVRVFLNYLEEDDEGRCKFVINVEPRIQQLVNRLQDQFGTNPFEIPLHPLANGRIPKIPDISYFGHPKFEKAKNCILQHFHVKPNSRAIVFCEYRESVMLMYQLLLQHVPLLKPRYFVGQGGLSGSLRPLTQKQQIQIMQDFRMGKSNILIATSIGEEGMDVGEVELIVCFDISTKNPQRFIQRIGRTGRRKQGNVVILVTEGQEEQILKDVLAQKDQTNTKILQSMLVKNSLYNFSSRLVPTDLDPKVVYVFIKPQSKEEKMKHGTKNNKTNQDLKNFLKRKMIKPSCQIESSSQHGLETQQNLEKCLNKIDEYFKAFVDPVATNTQLLMPNTLSQISVNKLRQSYDALQDSESFQRLRKCLEKSSLLIPSKALITTPTDQIKSPNVSNDGKIFVLRSYPSIVKDTLEKMKVLNILSLEPHEITSEERDIRYFYDTIEKLLGGTRSAVENFINRTDIKSMAEKRIYMHPFNYEEYDYKDTFKVIFQGLEKQLFLCDNFDYIQGELKKKEFYEKTKLDLAENDLYPLSYAPAEKDVESMVYETVILDEEGQNSGMAEFNTTKKSTFKSNQWDEFAKNAANKSTPLHGSIVKAFKRQLLKSEKKNTAKRGNLLYKQNECIRDSSKRNDFDTIYLSETSADELTVVKERSTNAKSNLNDNSSVFDSASDKEQSINLTNSIRSEFSFNMDSFLEPFPEENRSELLKPNIDDQIYFNKSTSRNTNLNLSQNEIKYNSSFISPTKVVNDLLNTSTIDFKSVATESGSERPATPPIRPQSIKKSYKRSPSLFEMFLQNVKNSSNLSENIKRSISFAENEVRKSINNINLNSAQTKFSSNGKESQSPEKNNGKLSLSHVDTKKNNNMEANCEAFMDTQIPMQYVLTSSNTKNFHPEAQLKPSLNDSSATDAKSEAGSETDCEEVVEIQKSKRYPCFKRKRNERVDIFLDDEAVASGYDESEEELGGLPCSQNVKDSMIVSSDEIELMDENQLTSTQMHVHYLQSIKSPKHIPRGAFKFPVFREYNDRNDIYSQTIPLEPSQYVCDSFVVEEADVSKHFESRKEILSPLERAERILKKRRRSHKKFKEVAKVQQRRRVYQVSDSSDDDLNSSK